MKEQARNSAIINEASLCNSSLEVVLALTKMRFKGTFIRKNLGLKKEITEYFNNKLYMDINTDYFSPKKEPEISSD